MAGPMTVKQTADTLTVERQGRNGAMSTVYKLDGSESEITMGQMTAKATAKWDGSKLVITTKTDQGEATQTWSLEGSTLTIERTGGRGPGKTTYKNERPSRRFGGFTGLEALAFSPFLLDRLRSPASIPVGASTALNRQPRHRVDQIGGNLARAARARTGVRESAGAEPAGLARRSHRLPARIRSRSSMRGAPGYGRVRPAAARSRAGPSAARAEARPTPNPDSVQIQGIAFEPRPNGQRLDER